MALEKDIWYNCLEGSFLENDEKVARILELEKHVRELEIQQIEPRRIRVPTSIGSQLQSMSSSMASYANIVIQNGAYVRLESE